VNTCTKCKESKEDVEFYKHSGRDSGLSAWCKSCSKVVAKTRQQSNYFREHQRTYRRTHRAAKLIGTIRSRARSRSMEFDLDGFVQEIQSRIDTGVCEMSGVRFDIDATRSFNSPSIDRIDSSKGYVFSNIRVVCLAMNVALNDWGEEALAGVMNAWLEKRTGAVMPELTGEPK
jgi:hypothetical protein